MKKKILFLLAAITVNAFFMANAKALTTQEYTEYELLQGGGIENIIANNQQLELRKAQEGIKKRSVIPELYGKFDNYPIHQQETNYWCGPATAQGIIEYLRGYTVSQSTIATAMGTNATDGTYVYRLKDHLNNTVGNQHTYVYEYISDTASNQYIYNKIYADVNSYAPVVLHARTKTLYKYNGTSLGHYLTAIGYEARDIENPQGTTYDYYIFYADNFYKNYGRGSVLGEWQDTLANVAATVKGRYLIY